MIYLLKKICEQKTEDYGKYTKEIQLVWVGIHFPFLENFTKTLPIFLIICI